MDTPQLPEQVPERPEAGGGFPVQPAGEVSPVPPPRPSRNPRWQKALNVACVTGAVAGGLWLLVTATTSRTCGATRSYRLQCEQRQQEVAAALQEETQATAAQQGPTQPLTPESEAQP